MRVLVTGATGFLGQHLVERLIAEGDEPVALVRASSDTSRLAALGVERRCGSLNDAASLAPLLHDVDAVAHCAGGGRAGAGVDLMQQNAGTTAALLDAITRSGRPLRRFVLVSSLSGHGPSLDGAARDEDAPPTPRSAYGRSKAEAERIARQFIDRVPITILRPPSIYGPLDDRWLAFFRAVQRGVAPVIGCASRTSVIYGPDCASAISLALRTEHPSGRTYAVSEPSVRTWGELGQSVARALGVRARVLAIPPSLVLAAGAVAEGVSQLRKKPSFFSLDKARDATAPHWVCDSARLRRELGWQPAVDFDADGARLTADWYQSQGLLARKQG